MLRGVPFVHPNAEIVPSGVCRRHVMRGVAGIRKRRCKTGELSLYEVGCRRKRGMVRNAEMRREDSSRCREAARVHAFPKVRVRRDRIDERRGRWL